MQRRQSCSYFHLLETNIGKKFSRGQAPAPSFFARCARFLAPPQSYDPCLRHWAVVVVIFSYFLFHFVLIWLYRIFLLVIITLQLPYLTIVLLPYDNDNEKTKNDRKFKKLLILGIQESFLQNMFINCFI